MNPVDKGDKGVAVPELHAIGSCQGDCLRRKIAVCNHHCPACAVVAACGCDLLDCLDPDSARITFGLDDRPGSIMGQDVVGPEISRVWGMLDVVPGFLEYQDEIILELMPAHPIDIRNTGARDLLLSLSVRVDPVDHGDDP